MTGRIFTTSKACGLSTLPTLLETWTEYAPASTRPTFESKRRLFVWLGTGEPLRRQEKKKGPVPAASTENWAEFPLVTTTSTGGVVITGGSSTSTALVVVLFVSRRSRSCAITLLVIPNTPGALAETDKRMEAELPALK